MTSQETLEMDLANERMLARYDALTLAAKLERLQKIGILDRNQRLSKRYGGDGEELQDGDDRRGTAPPSAPG